MIDIYQQSPSKSEILNRIENLQAELNSQSPSWDAVFIVDKVNQYYFTGTMQDGVFVLKKDGAHAYFARKSFDRAKLESAVDVYPMVSYRDVQNVIGPGVQTAFIESEVMTHGMLERLKKYFDITTILPADRLIQNVRAVKSAYELSVIEESGRQHIKLFEEIVPSILREGMSEAELTASLYKEMVSLGYHGLSRFSMFQTEIVVGQLGFGENSIYPTSFDGPGGMKGMSAAVPVIGDRYRYLKKGDLVFVDIGYGVNGYHSDKTQLYMFGAKPPEDIIALQRECINIQSKAAAMLKPGAIPADIYNSIIGGLTPEFSENFMGLGSGKVKFLGHGVGLRIDEMPVIANGFTAPLVENMVVALEPKKAVPGFGIVGVEDTFVVSGGGGRCLTGGAREIIVCG